MTTTRDAYKQQNRFLELSEAGSPTPGACRLSSGESLLLSGLVADLPSCLALTGQTEGWRVLWGLFVRALIPLARAPHA